MESLSFKDDGIVRQPQDVFIDKAGDHRVRVDDGVAWSSTSPIFKVDEAVVDVSNATTETLNCMAHLTKMAEMAGNKLSPTAAMAVCAAITVQKELPKAKTQPASYPA